MTEPLVAGSADIDIDRPMSVVRAHFFDLDQAIRERIHHGVALRWLPAETPGELRVEQETRALGRAQVDVYVLEEGEGGVCTQRFVVGPNAGVRVTSVFSAVDGGPRCHVRASAFTGPAGFRTGLGRLSPVGVEKLLQKMLEEHRRALEGYEPGRARGAVRAVLTPLREAVAVARSKARDDARAMMTNLLEAACAVAVADGKADDAERDVIQEVARTLCYLELDADAVDRMVKNVAAAIAIEGLEHRCDKIAARLASLGLGDVGLGVAALVAEVSHGLGVEEQVALSRLAAALGVSQAALDERIRKTDRLLNGP